VPSSIIAHSDDVEQSTGHPSTGKFFETFMYKKIIGSKVASFHVIGGPSWLNGLKYKLIVARLSTVWNQTLGFPKGLVCALKSTFKQNNDFCWHKALFRIYLTGTTFYRNHTRLCTKNGLHGNIKVSFWYKEAFMWFECTELSIKVYSKGKMILTVQKRSGL